MEPVSGYGACVYDDRACVYGAEPGSTVTEPVSTYVNHSIIESTLVPCPFLDFWGTFLDFLGLGLGLGTWA